MSDIIAEVEKKVKQKEAIKQRINHLEQLKMSGHLEFQEIDIIDSEIKKLEVQIGKQDKKPFEELDSFLDQFDLDVELVQNVVFKYIFDKFIVENETTMVAAPPARGKSNTAIGLSNHAAKIGKKIIYFDGDNGLATLKDRGIHLLKKQYGKQFRYIHESNATKSQMLNIIDKLTKTDLTGTFIVFDSIKNFITGDRDKNKDVSKTMDILKSLRRQGATILFLHHTSRPTKDLEELRYAGSSAWEEDTSNAFILKRNDYKNTFIFVPFKARVGDLQEIAFTYCSDTHTLTKVDIDWAKETEEHEVIRDEIIEFLKNQNEKPTYSQIMKYLIDQGYSNKDKTNEVIQSGKDKHWKATKIKEKNNRDFYELIGIDKSKETKIEIVYEDNSQIGKISHINSDKSYSRDTKGKEVLSDKSSIYLDRSQNMNIDMPMIL
ncbi:MAG: AAA family ATPase [Sulfuricurvum sp.]